MAMKKFFPIVLSLLILLTACGNSTKAQWQEQYDLGMQYYSEGKYDEAVAAFEKAIELDPQQKEATSMLSEVLIAQSFAVAENAEANTDNTNDNNKSYTQIISEAITPDESEESVSTNLEAADPSALKVDFSILISYYPDIVGYIYGANTGIQYPIVQSDNNDFYLNHDLDGNINNNGSIYMDFQCSSDFSAQNTIIYGHNLKSGLMFTHLTNYKNQSYYDEHPYFYIYTPIQNYKLNLFAGFVCANNDEVYGSTLSQSQLESMAAKSTFKSNIDTPTGNVVTLSTQSYDFDDARYVVVGELVPIN